MDIVWKTIFIAVPSSVFVASFFSTKAVSSSFGYAVGNSLGRAFFWAAFVAVAFGFCKLLDKRRKKGSMAIGFGIASAIWIVGNIIFLVVTGLI